MAKAYKNAPKICTLLSILALVGIVLGLLQQSALILAIFLLPVVGYEVYRTEGKSTKFASVGMLAVLLAEIALILFNVEFNLAEFLGETEKMIGGYWVPLGDLRILGPTLLAILSVILITNTRGRFTIWLAVIIFISSFALVYILDPTIFTELLKIGVREGLNQLN